MSDAVKWAILAAVIVALIAVVTATDAFTTIVDMITYIPTASSEVLSAFQSISQYLYIGRGLLNNFVVPQVLNYLLIVSFLYWVIPYVIVIGSKVIKFIYK